jgi:hypothetical protein
MSIWSLAHPCRLHWKRFGSDWVIYEEASNQTLVLDAAEIDILICLSAGALHSGALEMQVLDDLALQDNSETRLLVNVFISRLKSVGLISQIRDAPIPN